jgi:hypothetical protein
MAMAGDRSELAFRYWDGTRRRTVVGYVGENGLLPNVPYCLVNGVITRKGDGP